MADNSWETRPWSSILGPGIFVNSRREVWIYRCLPVAPLEWEDPPRRLEFQSRMERLLIELGDMSKDRGQGVRALSSNRDLHLLAIQYEEPSEIPSTTPPLLADFQAQVLFDTVPKKVLAVGVKLQRDAVSALTSTDSDDGVVARARKALKATVSAPTDLTLFSRDYDRVNSLLTRAGAAEPSDEQMTQLTSWFSNGRGVDVVLAAGASKLEVTGGPTWQISTLMGTDEQGMQLTSPDSTWLLDAMTHPEGARAVSVRAELEPATVTRGRLRRMQRVLRNQEEEEAATGDIGRDEIGEKQDMAKYVENYARSAGHAWLTNTSVLFAREMISRDPDETYADVLSGYYGMNIKVLERRQNKALAEMLPASTVRVNPFGQDVNPAWLAYSGVSGFGEVGDPEGLILGNADPQWTNVFIDEFAAANRNKSPIMGIFGEPGSGKAQPLYSQVLTPNGWVTMGELKVGDHVVSVLGKPTQVTGVYPQGLKDIWEVTFSDGSTARSCQEHLWAVQEVGCGGEWEVMSLEQLRLTLKEADGTARWQIPMAKPVEYPERSLPQDPYRFGRQARESCQQLPEEYLRSSVSQRLALLRGLLDAGGSVGRDGEVYYTCQDSPFTHSVQDLVQGLGGTLTPGGPGEWKVSLGAGLHPFTDVERNALCAGRSLPIRAVESVEYVGSEPAQCIQVEDQHHLYLTDSHIVTHNTFAAQLLTAQAALAGQSAIFINPKGFDSLKDFASWVADNGAPARVVSMQRLEKQGGAFDPFRFVEPKMAAEILARHINAVLGVTYSGGLTGKQEVELGRGLSQGAMEGAQCAFEALQYVRDKDIVEQVTAMVEASTLFALAFGRERQEPWEAGSGLTLIEFDREMPLPTPGKDYAHFEREERIAVAALRLVSRASLEILMRSRGGVLVVDEAHHFLSSAEGLATLERIGREGRSLGLLPIFATQRVTDLLKVDMESFMSRVLTLKLSDPKESEAALRLCRLDATPGRVGFLATAGAGRGFFRDLDDRHSLIQVGAGVPEDLRLAMSTNRADRLKKEADAARQG